MNAIVVRALGLWGSIGADYTLAAARENAVYRVRAGDRTVALRLHRQGYRADLELWSELEWMAAVDRGGINVPTPIPSASGDMLRMVDGVQVSVLTWLNGTTVDAMLDDFSPADRTRLFSGIGRQMARLHHISDAWTPPDGFTRCDWSRDGLLGEMPLWGRFWDNPMLSPDDRRLFGEMREAATAHLARIEADLDYGLIHADLVSANILVDGDRVQMIDFDDGGYGFRLFEIATALLKHREAEDYPALKAALIEGYSAIRAIDLAALDLFMLLRAATYVGWNISRMAEDGAAERNERFIRTARHLALGYLAR